MIGDRVISNMAVVAAMGIIVPEKPLSPSDINEAVFYPLRLSWIGWYSPDFNFYQGPIGFDNSPVDNEFSPWHIGFLTPYIVKYKRKAEKRDIDTAQKGEQDTPGLALRREIFVIQEPPLNASGSRSKSSKIWSNAPIWKKYGGKPQPSLKPLPGPNGDYHQDIASRIEWQDVQMWHALLQDADFNKVVPLRDAVVPRADQLHTKNNLLAWRAW